MMPCIILVPSIYLQETHLTKSKDLTSRIKNQQQKHREIQISAIYPSGNDHISLPAGTFKWLIFLFPFGRICDRCLEGTHLDPSFNQFETKFTTFIQMSMISSRRVGFPHCKRCKSWNVNVTIGGLEPNSIGLYPRGIYVKQECHSIQVLFPEAFCLSIFSGKNRNWHDLAQDLVTI